MVSLKRHQSNTLMTVKPLLQFSALIVSLEHQQQAQTVERVIGFSILRERLHTKSQRSSVRTGESKQLETSAMLGWFQQAGGGIHVWNVMSGDTHIDSVSWVLPDVHFLSTIMDDDQVCVYVCERDQMSMNTSLSFTLVCLQGQPDTCQCNEASGVWEHAGVVSGVRVTLLSFLFPGVGIWRVELGL